MLHEGFTLFNYSRQFILIATAPKLFVNSYSISYKYPVSMMIVFFISVDALVMGVLTFDLDRHGKLSLRTFALKCSFKMDRSFGIP
jgi:hypothetical protein